MFKKLIHLISGEIFLMLSFTLLFASDAFLQSVQQKERSEIVDIYKWNTTDIFKSDEAWQEAFQNLKTDMDKLNRFRNRLADSPRMMLECLRTRDTLDILAEKLSLYANLKSDEDTRVTEYQALRDQISSLRVQLNQKESYIQPEILAIPENTLWQFVEQNEELGQYKHYLEDLLRSQNHVLDQEGEKLLALAGDISRSPYQIFSMFNNADIRFPVVKNEEGEEIELTKGNFFVLMKSSDQEVRRQAFLAMYQTYQQWTNTLAASLSGAVKRDIFYAKARRYSSAREAALDADNIPLSVYDNVINTINDNLKPMHQYISLRKNILGVEKVAPWDLYLPLVKEFSWEIPYEEGVDLIEKALHPLGDTYVEEMKKGFKSGWFDVFENVGKRSGAYSTAAFAVPHPYMLLNYQDQLDDVFTTAHEMGHSMHSFFTLQNQPYIYSNYTIFVAEVASTLNEALLMDYMLKNTQDKQKKLYLLNQYIDQIRGTLYIQSIFAEFEKTIHEASENGQALTADFLSETARDLYTRYYGPDFEMDPLYDINWCRIPHFYYNFYVFQYATGISAATSLAQKILAGDTKTRDAYIEFLKRGNSDYSLNLLKAAGVDMSSPEPIVETTLLLKRLLNDMDKLINE